MSYKIYFIAVIINIITAVKNRKSGNLIDHIIFVLWGPVSFVIYMYYLIEKRNK